MFLHLFDTGESELGGWQASTKYMQPFHNHDLPLSPHLAKEECTPKYQHLPGLTYHFHREFPSCQSKDT